MPSPRNERHRVVVTGMGVVSPLGNAVGELWRRLLAGECGIQPIRDWDTDGYPARVAGIVEGFDATRYMDRQQSRRMERFAQFALAASTDAVSDAGLDLEDVDRDRMGIIIGSAIAGVPVIERESQTLAASGPRKVSPMLIPSVIGNMAGCLVSIALGVQGPVLCPVGACATGCIAVGDAFDRISAGALDLALAGGSESVTTPLAVASFGRLGALSRRYDDMSLTCRPFDVDRDGTVLAEGAAVLLLESEEHARARGARILAELLGYGVTADAYHVAAPDPDGTGAAKAMRAALARGEVSPEAVSYVCAHGTGTPLNDISESRAIAAVFGEAAPNVPVSSNKHALGHTLGAAGAISSVVAVQALREGIIPGTLNLRQKDPECIVNAVHENVKTEVKTVLVNAFGFGGQNASLVYRRWRD
ncbi:MAG: beta-ketoacyl-ACP synthase II [Anaerolineae bacterium]|nr:beta-ketoacyl-ACP synthase II [Anaerolineae bacterium]